MNPDLFLTEEGIAEIRRSQAARYGSNLLIDWIIDLIKQRKHYKNSLEQEKANVNKLKTQIGPLMKSKKTNVDFNQTELDNLLSEKQKLDNQISKNEVVVKEIEEILEAQMNKLGNIVDKSVPVSNDEADNRIEKVWGPIDKKVPLHHSEVMQKLGAMDMESASKISGGRTYFLTGPGLLINQALIQYGIDFLRQRGYEPTSTPFFMKKEIMGKTCQLFDYDEQLYKFGDDSYMIATSEQPLSARFISGTGAPAFLDPKKVPIRMAGFSSCFRKECGASGRDLRGLFRLHQFEKVEQFCIVAPEDSEKEYERMLALSEEFYQSLGLSYRVVCIVSGALNNAASKKWDIEAYFGNTCDYRELVSCSNCTDYQSRKLNIRYGYNEKDKKAPYVAMLNSTLVATERCMCCLMENYQTATGFNVPPVLQKYCYNIEKFDFITN